MGSVNSRFGSFGVMDARRGVFALAAFSAGLISTLPAMVAPVQAQEGAESAEVAAGPTVSIIKPQYADQLKGQVQILVGVRANGHPAKTIELVIDGKSAGGPFKMQSLPSSNFVWDTRLFTDGPHKLSVVVTDAGGYRGTQEVPIYINNARQKDLSPPALKWLNVKTGDTWRGVVNVQLKVVDDFGVKWLFLLLNPASEPLRKPARFSWFLNRPPYNFKIDSRKFEDGQYVLRALAYDVLENEGAAPSLTIGISNNSINPTFVMPDAPGAAVTPPKVTAQKSTSDRVAQALSNKETVQTNTPEAVASDTTPKITTPKSTETPVAPPGFTVLRPRPLPNRDGGAAQLTAPGASERVAAGSDAGRAAASPVISPSIGNAANSRIAPSESGENSGRKTTPGDRLAAVDASERNAPIGAPVVGYVEGGSRDGSVASPQSGGNSDRHEGSGKVSLPASTKGRMAAIERNTSSRNTAPSLSSATNNDAVARIAEAKPGRLAAASFNNGRLVAPMSPSRLPRIGTSRSGAPGTPNLSNVLANPVAAQGSVASPPSSPLFPNPSLSAPRDTRPASPLIAALPSLAPAGRAAQAAITVMPLASAIPAAHIVKQAQTLASVAKRFKLSVQLLAAANHLPVGASLKAGQKVLLPQPLQVSFEGQAVTGDVASMMMGETGVTPFRFLFEKQGGRLTWDGKNQRVTARNATHQVTLSIGSRTAGVNNKAVMMDLAAFLVSGRTMVPLRFFEKALQARVEWEPTTGRLFVAMAN